MSKKLLLPAVLALVLALVVAGGVLAQTTTPPGNATPNSGIQTAPAQGKQFRGFGGLFGMGGQNRWTEFDAIAGALNLKPADLFQQLHDGKTLSQIAQAQGVDLTTVQNAAQAALMKAETDAINQAVKDGRISQAQADWLQQGIKNGWTGGRGFGPGGRFGGMRGGMRGFGNQGMMPRNNQGNGNQTPQSQATPSL